MKPEVSICIPVFNREALVGRAIESCLSQTFSNIEVVVSDNASTDNTYDVIERYRKIDPRVVVVRNSDNYGALYNFKRALECARSKYVILLGSDDWLSSDLVQERIDGINACPDAAFVSGPMTVNEEFCDEVRCVAKYKYDIDKVSKEYVYRNFFKRFLVSYFCLFRKDDMLENFNMDWDDPFGWGVYRKGYGLDVVNCLDILKNYEYICYTKNGYYNFYNHNQRESEDIIKEMSAGKSGTIGIIHDYKMSTFLFYDYFSKLNRNEIADDLVSYKFNELLYLVVKKIFSDHRFREIFNEIVSYMEIFNIRGYSAWAVLLRMPFYSFYRICLRLLRRWECR